MFIKIINVNNQAIYCSKKNVCIKASHIHKGLNIYQESEKAYTLFSKWITAFRKLQEDSLICDGRLKYLLHVWVKSICLVDYIRGNLSSIISDKSIVKYNLLPQEENF
ncbi:hypothetical protein CLI64_08390 [Nostoc sp. CENA543]|nr:hypothetical protein CLI64_08390 [Nostoc sp. CENA543]